MLALSFLLLIGASLVAEAFDHHIPKGYIYGPIAFSLLVEALNLRAGAVAARRAQARAEAVPEPVHLRTPYVRDTPV
jgi:predicted tellurium resistance membrane protein TerC